MQIQIWVVNIRNDSRLTASSCIELLDKVKLRVITVLILDGEIARVSELHVIGTNCIDLRIIAIESALMSDLGSVILEQFSGLHVLS